MLQIIPFSKAMMMHFYAMTMVKFGETSISDHLFLKTTFVLHLNYSWEIH